MGPPCRLQPPSGWMLLHLGPPAADQPATRGPLTALTSARAHACGHSLGAVLEAVRASDRRGSPLGPESEGSGRPPPRLSPALSQGVALSVKGQTLAARTVSVAATQLCAMVQSCVPRELCAEAGGFAGLRFVARSHILTEPREGDFSRLGRSVEVQLSFTEFLRVRCFHPGFAESATVQLPLFP